MKIAKTLITAILITLLSSIQIAYALGTDVFNADLSPGIRKAIEKSVVLYANSNKAMVRNKLEPIDGKDPEIKPIEVEYKSEKGPAKKTLVPVDFITKNFWGKAETIDGVFCLYVGDNECRIVPGESTYIIKEVPLNNNPGTVIYQNETTFISDNDFLLFHDKLFISERIISDFFKIETSYDRGLVRLSQSREDLFPYGNFYINDYLIKYFCGLNIGEKLSGSMVIKIGSANAIVNNNAVKVSNQVGIKPIIINKYPPA